MTRVAAVFEGTGIVLDDLGLQRPSLDDVFLHLTGHAAEEEGGPNSSLDEPAGLSGRSEWERR